MNQAIFFIILFTPIAVFGQEEPSQKISLGISIMPDISFRTIKSKAPNESAVEIRNSEKRVFSYSAGFNARYKLNKNISIYTGILYSKKGYQTGFESLNWSTPTYGFPTQSKTIFNFSYIEFPANLTCHITGNNDLLFYVIIGLSPAIFISRQTKIISKYPSEISSQSNSRYIGYSRFNLFGNIGTGISYKLSNRFTVLAEPKFQHSINSITVSSDAKEYLHNAGIDFKCYYSLLKKSKK